MSGCFLSFASKNINPTKAALLLLIYALTLFVVTMNKQISQQILSCCMDAVRPHREHCKGTQWERMKARIVDRGGMVSQMKKGGSFLATAIMLAAVVYAET